MNALKRHSAAMLVTISTLATFTTGVAQDTLGHWVFAKQHLKQGKLTAQHGSLNPSVQGRARMLSAPSALVLTGRDDRVTITKSIRKANLPKGAFSISSWTVVDKPQAWGSIVSVMQDNGNFEKGWLLGYRGTKFCFGLATEGADDGDGKLTYLTAKHDFEPGSWHHILATYDLTTMRLYVDGVLSASSTSQSGAVLYPRRATFEIGAYLDDDEHFPMQGLIHDVLLEDLAVTPSEVANRYSKSHPIFKPEASEQAPAIAAWKFDRAYAADQATANSTTLSAKGRKPEAVLLDGKTSFAVEPSLPSVTKAISIEASVWIANPKGRGTIISTHDISGTGQLGWRIDYIDGHFRFVLTAGSEDDNATAITADSLIRAFHWHQVCATYDGTQMRLYVDGKIKASSRNELGLIRLPQDPEVRIGAQRTANGLRYGKALIHKVAIYPNALDSKTIALHRRDFRRILPGELYLSIAPRLRYTGQNRARVHWSHRNGDEQASTAAVEYLTPSGQPKRIRSNSSGPDYECEIEDIPRNGDFTFRLIQSAADGTEKASSAQTIDTTFNYSEPPKITGPSAYPKDEQTAIYRTAAREILDDSGINKGFCVVLDASTGRLAYELAMASDLQIIAIEEDPKLVAIARKTLSAAGLYGPRITVIQGNATALPFGDFFANLIVSDRVVRSGQAREVTPEIERILRPNGGYMLLGPKMPVRRPPLEGAGNWTHQYGDAANTSSSGDMRVAGELEIQWFGKPGPRPMLDRGCRAPAPQYAGGRLFIQGDRKLFALDAYNGTILWTLEIPALRRVNMPRDSSNMCATEDHIYLAVDKRCWKIDAQTGDLIKAFYMPIELITSKDAWGYLGISGGMLLGTSTLGSAIYKSADGEWYDKQDKDAAPVLGKILFGINRQDHKPTWQYHGGLIVHPTITVHNDTIYFVEERKPSKATQQSFRLLNMDGKNQYLVALDLNTGNMVWERQFDFSKCKQVFYLSAAKNTLTVLGTSGRYNLYGFDASTGTPLWSHSHSWKRDHHGGAMQHPVIVGDSIYAEMKALDLRTGKVTREDLPERRGCGTMSASGRSLFYRHYHHGMWDLETDRRVQMPGIRSGCWLGMIPAGGLLLAPESSSGCSCAIPIQSSVAYRPISQPR